MRKKRKYARINKIAFVLGILIVLFITTVFWYTKCHPFYRTTQISVENISNLNSLEFSEIVREMIGGGDEEMYIFFNDAPRICLNSEFEVDTMHFSFLVPISRSGIKNYVVYQLRLEKQTELSITKCCEVNNLTKLLSMSDFLNSLIFMPVTCVESQAEKKASQYMLTLFEDNFVFSHDNIENQVNKEKLVYYDYSGKVDVKISEPVISWVVLPLYRRTETPYGFSGISSDSFVFQYLYCD